MLEPSVDAVVRRRAAAGALVAAAAALLLAGACSATGGSRFGDGDGSGNNGQGAGDTTLTSDGGLGFGGQGGGAVEGGDPKTCEEAASAHTYIGCDFWPTVTPNNVWNVFDFAAVVANAGEQPVDVSITRNGQTVGGGQIAPDSLGTYYLPWVMELKGPEAGPYGEAKPVTASAHVPGGAYHLTSTYPVTVYQFNALEYAPQGGPPGKNWSSCPADGFIIECFSYSNDASLLLPSTAMTGNYRITGTQGWETAGIAAYFVVTAVMDGTTVNMGVSGTGAVASGGGLGNVGPNGSASFSLDQGDAQLVLGTPSADLSGTLLSANHPIQVVSGIPCTQMPFGTQACDHVEETVFPAETLGQHYVVTQPTGPSGNVPGHVVRIYGNFDGTKLTYPGGAPAGAPDTIDAGDVVDLGVVTTNFEVQGDQSFVVASIQLGGEIVDAGGEVGKERGDPAFTLPTAVEQYRDKYVFLAPTDYDVNYVDVVMPTNAQVTLDGQPLGASVQPVGANGFGLARVALSPSTGGAHLLTASAPVGIQVSGYGSYTSYYYPGGLNLKVIAPPPVN